MSARHIHKHSIESEFELYDMIVAILITIKSGDWSFYKEIDMWLYYIDWMIDCLNIVKSCCLVAPQRIFGQCLLCIKIFNVMIINEKTSCINEWENVYIDKYSFHVQWNECIMFSLWCNSCCFWFLRGSAGTLGNATNLIKKRVIAFP